ncbi:MAG: 1-(5-phosphoribosyl)-5-[(5-phosphoribosylamino)methylideneamino]imidazole-4-carboxamide isomerase [Candidatus Bathyarchaeota archaeon]|nr:1-(5-phosphoribosyl)-5-[(5-phosphoribosylamino)methylideneamino]imidazole-4-carboxamide isomerase [Candidatus Bathyarchaeota archaeon]
MTLQVIPAIDIMDGQLVRLTKGDPETKESYSVTRPMEAAIEWAKRGAELVHIIDLDAALGKQPNTETILEIAKTVPLQVGGGIRSAEVAKRLLDGGVQRIILGSMPVKAPEKARKLLDEYGSERIVLALDHKDGYLMVKGWQESTKYSLMESLMDFKAQGYTRFLVTNIDHDGVMNGPDTKTYAEISDKAQIIASGGVSSIQDIKALTETGVESVVVGKALYMKRFTLEEAQEAALC